MRRIFIVLFFAIFQAVVFSYAVADETATLSGAMKPEWEARYFGAVKNVEAGNTQAALPVFRELAAEGSYDAMSRIGWIYSNGKGVPVDKQAALVWYKKSGEAGLAGDLFNVGAIYDRGVGVPQDHAQAFYWYQRAADAGDAQARYNVAEMLLRGTGVAKDEKRARALMSRAGDAGDPVAQQAAGWLAEHGIGGPVQESIAFRWYKMAYDQEKLSARDFMIDLAHRVNTRAETQQAEGQAGQAMTTFDLFCLAGEGIACYNAGVNRLNGRHGVEKNPARALSDFRGACDIGVMNGCLRLGSALVLASNAATKEDIKRGYRAFETDCMTGNNGSCYNLAFMEYYPQFGMQDQSAAQTRMQKLCFDAAYQPACAPFYSMYNAALANSAPRRTVPAKKSWLDDWISQIEGFNAGMRGYGATSGAYGGYTPSASSSGSSSSYSSSSSSQDTANFNDFIRANQSIGTGYSSSCRSGNPYC